MKLYYAPGACSMAPHIALEWIGKPYEAIRVDQHDPDFRKINPAAAVPAFDFGGAEPLTQCAAILLYLARTHPGADLLDDRTPESMAQLDRWSAFLTGDLHPSFFPVFMPSRYTASSAPAALEAVQAAGRTLVQSKLKLLDQHLQGRTWMVGDKRTILDAYATPMTRWAVGMLPEGIAAYPALSAHHAMMLADPAVLRVLADEGLS
jgi:glutathione S-transferase